MPRSETFNGEFYRVNISPRYFMLSTTVGRARLVKRDRALMRQIALSRTDQLIKVAPAAQVQIVVEITERCRLDVSTE